MLLPTSVKVWLARDPVDLRRGHDGLAALVRTTWKVDPFSGHLFVFFGKRKDRVKIPFWSRGGFVLYYKRLESGVFRVPSGEGAEVQLDAIDLTMLPGRYRSVTSPPAAALAAALGRGDLSRATSLDAERRLRRNRRCRAAAS